MNMKTIFICTITMILIFSGLSFADINITSTSCSIAIGTSVNETDVNVTAGSLVATTISGVSTWATLPADGIVRIISNQIGISGVDCIIITRANGLTLDLNGTTLRRSTDPASPDSAIRILSLNNSKIINGTIQSNQKNYNIGAIIGVNTSTNVTISNVNIYNISTDGTTAIDAINISNTMNWTLNNISISNLSTNSIGLAITNSTGIKIINSQFGGSSTTSPSNITTRWMVIRAGTSTENTSLTNVTFNTTAIDLLSWGGNTTISQQDGDPISSHNAPTVGSSAGSGIKFINITNNSAIGATANLTMYTGSSPPNTVGLYTTTDSISWVIRSYTYPFSGTSVSYLNFVVGTIYALFGGTTTLQSTGSSGTTSPPPVEESIPMGDVNCGTDGKYHFTSASNPDSYGVNYGQDTSKLTHVMNSGNDYSFDFVGLGDYYATVYKSPDSNYRTYHISEPCGQKELEVLTAITCPSNLVVTVTDVNSGAAVSDASITKGTGPTGSLCLVSTSNGIKNTDSSGKVSYPLSEFSSNYDYCFEASKSGYLTKKVDVKYSTLSCGTTVVTTEVSCPAGTVLKATAKDQNGNPLSGILGLFRGSETGEYSHDIQIGINGEGSASIIDIGEEGDYIATFTPDNHIYQPYRATITIKSQECAAPTDNTDGTTTGTDTTGGDTTGGNSGGDNGGSGNSGGSGTPVNQPTVTYDLQTQDSGNVGDDSPVTVTKDNKPYSNAKVLATLPNGKVITLTTDSEGKIILPLEFAGQYKLSLLNEQGDTVKNKNLQALATKTGGDGFSIPGLTIFSGENVGKTAIVAVVGLVVIVGAYFYFRGREGGSSEDDYKSKRGSKN
ncbi:MAG: hypothetical protein Q7S22_08500 [Candidatus Micrarchaeota archaeon]|nr:hypothetical protein [Candidatus Micrarchaeota archaeon]